MIRGYGAYGKETEDDLGRDTPRLLASWSRRNNYPASYIPAANSMPAVRTPTTPASGVVVHPRAVPEDPAELGHSASKTQRTPESTRDTVAVSHPHIADRLALTASVHPAIAVILSFSIDS